MSDDKPKQKKRRPKRKLVELPECSNGSKCIELISNIKCTLNHILLDPRVKHELDNLVFTVNQHRKQSSMLTKELLLAILEEGTQLPKLDQSFFSALVTAMRNGKWNKTMISVGHEKLLQRHHVSCDSFNKTLFTQVMALEANRMSAHLQTHYKMHYERFLRRWKKLSEDDRGGHSEDELTTDPEVTDLRILILNAWKMRRCLETAKVTRKGFALFPEARSDMSYITLDNTCITQLFKQMYPESSLLFRMGEHNGSPKKYLYPANDLAIIQGKAIWNRLIDMGQIQKLRGKDYHFRWSMKTNGYGVVLSFGKFHEYVPSSKRRKTLKAKHMPVKDLEAGYAYSHQNKTLDAFQDLDGLTVRAVDPGVHRTYTSVDLLTNEAEVRSTAMKMRGVSWYKRIKSKQFGDQQNRWRKDTLVEEEKVLNAAPYCTSSFPDRYAKYVDATYACWSAVWNFVKQKKRRKLRFRAWCIRTRELDREVDRLCAPREGDTKTVLIYGNGARSTLFGKVRSGVRGPAKELFKRAQQRKKAITIWADEYRTSKLDPTGHVLKHPLETNERHLKPPKCRATQHGPTVRGCRCHCSRRGCEEKRNVKYWCANHKKPVLKHDVCYQTHGEPKHRMWNRDVCAAVNIGCLFLAQAMRLDVGPWTRGAKTFIPKSWLRVFDGTPPYSFAKSRRTCAVYPLSGAN